MTREQWAFAELDRRRAEERRFPVEPPYGDPARPAFARMKRQRAMRRKAMGYSRGTAFALVQWAERKDHDLTPRQRGAGQ